MGGYSLPQLRVAQPPDLIGQQDNLLRLRALQQQMGQQAALAPLQQQAAAQQVQVGQLQLQQQQQAMKDQQAMTAAMQQWDGKDLNGLVPLVVKNGASANAVIGLKQKVLEQKKQASDIAASDATTGSKNVATMMQKNDMISGALSTVLQTPDAQLPQAVMATAQDLAQKGLLDPQHVQMAEKIAQSGDPAQIRTQLDAMRKGMMANSQILDDAQKQASIQKTKAEMAFGPTGPAADSKYRFLEAKVIAKQPISDADKNWMEAYKKQKLLVPVISGQVREAGYASSRLYPVFDNATKQTMYVSASDLNAMRAENPARYSPASYSPESIGQRDTTGYFTKGKGGQQLTAFNTAIAHLSTLDTLADALKNSNLQVFNKAAQAWAQQTGNPAPTNFEAAKNAMAGEVASALKASGATDQEIEKVDQTFSRAQSPAQLKGAIGTYRTLLNSKAHMLQEQYQQGMQGKPNFVQQPGEQSGGGSDFFSKFGGTAH